jgi:hypothetical protein
MQSIAIECQDLTQFELGPPNQPTMNLPNLTPADVQSIERLAASVQKKTAFGPIPNVLAVGGIDIPIRAVAPTNFQTGSLGDHDLRALYSPTQKDIQLYCSGCELPKGCKAFNHIVCVIGHEALHAIQYSHFSELQAKNASMLGKKACESPEFYCAYISCEVELPAHAVMIALELRHSDPPSFEEAASKTSVYSYFVSRLHGASMMDDTLKRLVAAAREMHRHLSPPKAEILGT